MRLFTAVELNHEATQELLRLQQEAKKQFISRKWQTPERMHLTLHFLGELSATQADTVKQELRLAAASCQPFELCLTDIGAFPSLQRPRVLWAGIDEQDNCLSTLQRTLSTRLQEKQLYEEERRYSPHITLARNVSVKNEASAHDPLLRVQPVRWTVHELTLFRSTLTKEGPLYVVIEKYPFIP